jgi:hypothetical protein
VRVVAYAPDLMDRSKLAAAAGEITFVPRPAELAGAAAGADLVVVDLGRAGSIGALADIPAGVRVIGFGSHVDRDTLERAGAAGCEAMPRSQFFRSLGGFLAP